MRRRALAALADMGDESPLTSSALNGGTFSLLPSESVTRVEVRARFGLGVGSGVCSWSQGLGAGDESRGWWLRLPRTELRVIRVVCMSSSSMRSRAGCR